jgi:hypothetical protein
VIQIDVSAQQATRKVHRNHQGAFQRDLSMTTIQDLRVYQLVLILSVEEQLFNL